MKCGHGSARAVIGVDHGVGPVSTDTGPVGKSLRDAQPRPLRLTVPCSSASIVDAPETDDHAQLLRILRESIKAVPAMKYALAVAGILAMVAMVGAFKISPAMAVFGAVITLVLMVAMVIFARLTTTAPRHFFSRSRS